MVFSALQGYNPQHIYIKVDIFYTFQNSKFCSTHVSFSKTKVLAFTTLVASLVLAFATQVRSQDYSPKMNKTSILFSWKGMKLTATGTFHRYYLQPNVANEHPIVNACYMQLTNKLNEKQITCEIDILSSLSQVKSDGTA